MSALMILSFSLLVIMLLYHRAMSQLLAIRPSGDEFVVCLQRFLYTMRTIQGSLIVSSFVNIILGYSKAWGNFTRLVLSFLFNLLCNHALQKNLDVNCCICL